MPRLRCPQCSNVVDVAPGAAAVCTVCGFSGPAPASASAAGAGPATARSASAKKGMGGGAIAAIAIAVLLVLGGGAAALWFFVLDDDDEAGGTSGTTDPRDGPLSQAGAEAVAQAAAQRLFESDDAGPGFLEDINDPFLDDLRKVTATLSGEDEDLGGEIDGTFAIDWGTGDVVHMAISIGADAGGFSFDFSVDAYCSPDAEVMVFGNDAYEVRPSEDGCAEAVTGDDFFEDDGAEEDDIEFVSATPLPDGGVEAVFQNETATMTMIIDNQDRITSLELEDEMFSMTMAFEYGPRQAITVPQATQRLPADLYALDDFEFDGVLTYEVWSADADLPRDEFTLRLHDGDCDAPLAEFDMAQDQDIAGPFVFEWLGDGDSLIEENDTFRISQPGEDIEFGYDICFYDEWAMAVVGDTELLPGAPVWLLAGALAVAALARRRRDER